MKQTKAQKYQAAIELALAAARATDLEPRRPMIRCRPAAASDRLVTYLVGDSHVGMLAQGAETGQGKAGNWDLAIAELSHETALASLLSRTPPDASAILMFAGDNCHVDSHANETPRSGHQLDVDARFPVVLETLFRLGNRMLRMVADHHGAAKTGCYVVTGNHDASVSAALRLFLVGMNPDVAVSRNQSAYHALRFGTNFLGFAHGHLAKPAAMPGVFAADFSASWGATTTRRLYHGHIHSRQVTEARGCSVESLATLAPPDQYAADGGWRSERAMVAVEFDKEAGEVGRYRYELTKERAAQIVAACGGQSRRRTG